jgi:hypothetical protein
MKNKIISGMVEKFMPSRVLYGLFRDLIVIENKVIKTGVIIMRS